MQLKADRQLQYKLTNIMTRYPRRHNGMAILRRLSASDSRESQQRLFIVSPLPTLAVAERRLIATLAPLGQQQNALFIRSISSTATDGNACMEASVDSTDAENKTDNKITPATTDNIPLETVDKDVQQIVAKLKDIRPSTSYDDSAVEQVLEDSWTLLQKRLDDHSPSAIPLLHYMQHLLDIWYSMHRQNVNRHSSIPKTSRPFEILLEAWTRVSLTKHKHSYGEITSAGSQTCQVLQHWYEILGGDLALAPTMADFQKVLAAYAATSTNIIAGASSTPTNTNKNTNTDTNTALVDIASEAYNVVQELKHWGYTMEPTMETNAHLVRCLSNVIQMPLRYSQKEDHSSAKTVAWDRLQQVMNEGVLPIAKKYQTPKAKGTRIFDTRQPQDPQELLYLSQAMTDALCASKQYMNNKDFDLMCASDCQLWGIAWNITFLQRPDQLETVLDYGEENHLPYMHQSDTQTTSIGNDLPPVFHMLVDGCEAWQFLLHHYFSKRESSFDYHPTEAVQQIHSMLEQLEQIGEKYNNDNNLHSALLRSYLLTIKAWDDVIPYMETPDQEQARQLRDNVLRRFETRHFQLVESLQAAEKETRMEWGARLRGSWNTLMSAKFHVGKVDEVHQLWKKMNETNVTGDAVTYAIVLKALADSTHSNAAPQAHGIWKRMRERWYKNLMNNKAQDIPKPTGQHYASVIVAWSRSPHPKAAQRALQTFQQLEKDHEKELQRHQNNTEGPTDIATSLKPTPVHYSALLLALTRSLGVIRQGKKAFSAETQAIILNLVDQMLALPESYLNKVACGAALGALAKIGTQEAALISQRIMDEVEERWKHGKEEFKPNAQMYANCMLAWSRAAERGEVTDVTPQVEGLLRRLESEFLDAGKDPSLLPNEIVYCALLNSVIVSEKVGTEERVEEVLHDMENKAASGLAVPPNDFVYCKAISAYYKTKNTKGDSGEKAEAILERMRKAYYQDGVTTAKPTIYAYNGVIQVWAKSPCAGKAKHASRLLKQIQDAFSSGDLDLRPNKATYASALKCCAFTPTSVDAEHRQEAVRAALQIMLDLEGEKSEKPTNLMYSLILQTIGLHVEDDFERRRLASAIFQKCCEEGFVNPSVLATLHRHAFDLYKKLPAGGKDFKALPSSWTRHSEQFPKDKAARQQ